MLEIREYTRKELAAELHVSENTKQLTDCIQKKLKRMGVDFTTNERKGDNRIFYIHALPDDFKLYCIDKFGCAPNTDFQKMREVFFLALNDDSFLTIPDTEKQDFITLKGLSVSRGTISRYIRKLEDANYFGGGEFVYLSVSKDTAGNHTSKPITKERYNEGWKIYWSVREETNGDYMIAYEEICRFLGGHPLKRLVPQQNVFMLDEIDELQRIIAESYERDLRRE